MKLVFEQGVMAGQSFTLTQPAYVIGRGKNSDIVLLEHGVSREHARLAQERPGSWMLTDLGSTNGTQVNGQPLRPQEAYLLRPGDRVTMGHTLLSVQAAAAEKMAVEEAAGLDTIEGARKPHPLLLVAGALLVVIVLVGLVAVLVLVLQPGGEAATPTPGDRTEQFMTAVPVPTEFQDAVATILPGIPTGLPEINLGATATPSP